LDDPVDDPVDMDQLDVDPTVDGEFAEECADDPHPDPEWVEPAPPTESEERTFDAFNASTWNFKPAPTPWYRTGHAAPVIVAVSIAVVALIVSVVLLAFRGSSDAETVPASETSTVPTSSTAPSTTSDVPLPPPPPPPPPPPTASEIERAPVIVRQQPRPTKKPEINVTRLPMSVSPQKPSR
jgi:hypothetical protein